MQILITPEDIIKRCLWYDYRRFCLKDKTNDEINKIIEENKPTTIDEDSAYVIGLLKIVDTPNIMHRFRLHIDEVLKEKSNIYNNKLYIIRSVILRDISLFKNRFPESYKPPFEYKIGIDEMINFSNYMYSEVEKLPIHNFQNQDKIYSYVSSNQVKDLLKEDLPTS